jgi:hypothetical protein
MVGKGGRHERSSARHHASKITPKSGHGGARQQQRLCENFVSKATISCKIAAIQRDFLG